ncbi:MAG: beta-ketoacyl-[acyl-carrier-protein] synthase II [Chloroflexi bacterium AL-W]|nr:beta-ketoacyl-[acyl-carrier-protein] synthase II [Chloroflexi bacterium AL-N1]NOK65676.1 beta-ketoacyl-[acyl-carrier-protein] synthase II [Chloroflexi bacterium AL-N10]NOK74383.1 beta-ketoacyl-[acyl-carrier-protein] synthase II [Chloroflexi bacterium AL-N5]NOK80709.1 beta-ketoacyl-[acyl-carrier-protein] synthase II [Chloroflexi bacterium AL-W]NOK88641.1 beta-ketoacyl-[acyl-carrier-protein] synthase II [Chloroflexi bacterium AL-N15]
MERRVVVTGLGVLSPLGLGTAALWDGIQHGRSGITTLTLCDTDGLPSQIGGEVKGFDPKNYMETKLVRRTDRYIQFALATADEALRSAELVVTPDNVTDIGAIIGSGIGGITTLMEGFHTLEEKGPGRVSPFLIPSMISNMGAGQVSITHGLKGPNYCTTSACASGAHAIGESFETIRRGNAKVMVTGGSEAPIVRIAIASFANARAVSTRNDEPASASRPFDATRDGFVLSEGAAILILEDLEFAQQRGARILAEMVGYGLSADAHHITLPQEDGEGAFRAMHMALTQSGSTTADVDYINAHGTSTPSGDIAETKAIKRLLGERAYQVPVSSSKSQFGHLLGAAGPIEAVVTILALQQGILPPTINYQHSDTECDLDYVPNQMRRSDIQFALSNSFGFGGHNATLAFRRFVS